MQVSDLHAVTRRDRRRLALDRTNHSLTVRLRARIRRRDLRQRRHRLLEEVAGLITLSVFDRRVCRNRHHLTGLIEQRRFCATADNYFVAGHEARANRGRDRIRTGTLYLHAARDLHNYRRWIGTPANERSAHENREHEHAEFPGSVTHVLSPYLTCRLSTKSQSAGGGLTMYSSQR